jgi:hypothetical protein
MKLVSVLMGILITVVSMGQTNVSGGIFQNATWTLAGSPYVVTGSIVVFPNVTLNIEPGVTILIDNATSNDIYIETRGTLNLVGTDQLPITVRTLQDTASVGWQGFKCISSQGGVLNADRFRISNAVTPFFYEAPLSLYNYTNCAFTYCDQAITVGNEVKLNKCLFKGNNSAVYGWSLFTIDSCTFSQNNTAINAYSTLFELSNSTFTENTNAVVFSSGVFDTMTIRNCIFQMNGTGISSPNNGSIEMCSFLDNTNGIVGSYFCVIASNVFNYNELALDVSALTIVRNNQINTNFGGVRISGITSMSNAPVIVENEICSNVNYNVDNNTNVNYSLLTNCFCGLDSTQIEFYILDGYDDISKGLINYHVYDSTCLTVMYTVSKFGETATLDEELANFGFTNPVVSRLDFNYPEQIKCILLVDQSGRAYTLNANGYNSFDLENLPSGTFVLRKVNDLFVFKKVLKI